MLFEIWQNRKTDKNKNVFHSQYHKMTIDRYDFITPPTISYIPPTTFPAIYKNHTSSLKDIRLTYMA